MEGWWLYNVDYPNKLGKNGADASSRLLAKHQAKGGGSAIAPAAGNQVLVEPFCAPLRTRGVEINHQNHDQVDLSCVVFLPYLHGL